jgi:hypothetical protein
MGRSFTTFAVASLVALAASGIAVVWLAFPACGCAERWDGPAPKTAVIVDQLELTSPDPDFVEEATQTLERAGYAVDYVPGEDVTVDYYRELPSMGYGLVLIRAHSGFVLRGHNNPDEPQEPFIFTSEEYDEGRHASDRAARRLSAAYYLDTDRSTITSPDDLIERFKDEPRYFGVKPSFIEASTKGSFPGSTVVLMGCSGLTTEGLAEAFVERGARHVIGWNDLVSAPHTDSATARLLERLYVDGLPVAEAVEHTASEVGPDPTYNGALTYYQ